MNTKNKLTKFRYERIILVVLFAYFIIRGLELTFTILPFIGPDEGYHIDLAVLFSSKLGMVKAADLGAIGFILPPQYMQYLYHFAAGKLLWLNVLPIQDYEFLRLVNLALATLTAAVSYTFAKHILKNTFLAIALVAILTNIPNFSFISATVGYDNLINLLSVSTLYLMVQLFDSFDTNKLYTLLLLLLMGTLTKITFVPLAILIATSLAWSYRNKISHIVSNLTVNTISKKLKVILILLFTLVNLRLYVGNIVQFGHIQPECYQVMSIERCATTTRVSRLASENVSRNPERLSLGAYSPHWYLRTIAKILHHGGHKWIYLPIQIITFVSIVSIISLIMVALNIKNMSKAERYLLIISVLYIAFLFSYVYLFRYLPTGFVFMAINGRYLFPIITPLLILVVNSLNKFTPKYFKVITIALIVFFILVDYPYFKANLTIDWTKNWYALPEVVEGKVHPLDYLDANNHTGEPHGWSIYVENEEAKANN